MYQKSSSLLRPSRKNVSEFDNPVDILLNHLAVIWDQHVNNNCAVQNSRIHFGQVILVPISKHFGTCATDFVPNLTALEERVHSHVWKLMQIFILDLRDYIEPGEEAAVSFLSVISFLGPLDFFTICWILSGNVISSVEFVTSTCRSTPRELAVGCWITHIPVLWKDSFAIQDMALWSMLSTHAVVKTCFYLGRTNYMVFLIEQTFSVSYWWRYLHQPVIRDWQT